MTTYIVMLDGPLEQFEIVSLFRLGGTTLMSNSSIFLLLSVGVLMTWIVLAFTTGGLLVGNRWQIMLESMYIAILDMIGQTLGSSKSMVSSFFVFMMNLFTLLLAINLIGIVPYSFTVSSHIIAAFLITAMIWFGKLIIGSRLHGVKLSALVMPGGAPLVLLLPLIAIETLGFAVTLVSLPVRLFANMMSGHILLKVLGGFAWTMAVSGSVVLFAMHLMPMVVLFMLMFLETGVAFIQAYVFSLLTCIYFADSISGGH